MEEKHQDNLWSQILSESRSSNKYNNVNLLFLGNKNCGKRTFINQLSEISKTKLPTKKTEIQFNKFGGQDEATAYSYTYLNIINLEDEENETMARLNVFTLDDLNQKNVLPLLMNENTIESLIVIIMLDFSEPFNFQKSLTEWMDAFSSTYTQLNIPYNKLDNMRQNIIDYLKSYEEPQFDEDGKLITRVQNQEDLNLKQQIKLPDGVLASNQGIPIILLANKSDLVNNIEKEPEGEQKLDFIQFTLRQFCIMYGATLFFSSCKTDLNIKLFYEYVLHRFFNFPLKYKPETINKEAIFIPSGFDSPNLINDTFKNIDKDILYEDFIVNPVPQKNVTQQEQKIEDEQQFLQALKEKFTQDEQEEQIQVGKGQNLSQQQEKEQNKEILNNFYQNFLDKPENKQKKSIQAPQSQQQNQMDLRKQAEKYFEERINNKSWSKKDSAAKPGQTGSNIKKEELNKAQKSKLDSILGSKINLNKQ